MKKRIYTIIIALIGIAAMLTLTGCGSNNSQKTQASQPSNETHLAIVWGTHANSPAPNTAVVADGIYQACYDAGAVNVITAEGEPVNIPFDLPKQREGLTDSKHEQLANQTTGEILSVMSQLTAQSEEVDSMRAIQLAARTLETPKTETADATISKKLYILDSFLPTTGVLSFVDTKLGSIDVDDVVNQLTEMEEIPNLEGVDVVLCGVGDTAAPQTKIPEKARKQQIKLLTAICEEGGAASVSMECAPSTTEYDANVDLPKVTTIDLEYNGTDLKGTNDVGESLSAGGIVFDEDSIAFCKGSADVVDRDAAQKSLSCIAEYMAANPNDELLILGTTAKWGGREYCQKLSKQRAEAIKNILSEQADSSRITAIGLGYESDYYQNDQLPDGSLNKKVAKTNRAVHLLDISSEKAQRALKQ